MVEHETRSIEAVGANSEHRLERRQHGDQVSQRRCSLCIQVCAVLCLSAFESE
jgi:hypothetical protein